MFNPPKKQLKKMVEAGEYKEAIEFGKSIESKHSRDSDFFFIMGSIYYMMGAAQNALHYFDKALAIKEKDVDTLLLKANVHLYLKEEQKVSDCCHKILDIEPDNEDAKEILLNLEKD